MLPHQQWPSKPARSSLSAASQPEAAVAIEQLGIALNAPDTLCRRGNFLYDEDSDMLHLIDFGASRDFPSDFVMVRPP